MKFSYNWLQSFFKKKLPPPKRLAEFLTLHSFEVKEIKKQGRDYIFNIDVLPNRVPDCGGHLGIAREISAILKIRIKNLKYKIKEDLKNNTQDFIEVEVKDHNICPRYSARVISDVKVRPSPKWLKERLESCGLQSINNIVDIANYVMLETGQPLHAFDFDKIKSVNSKIQMTNDKQILSTPDRTKFGTPRRVAFQIPKTILVRFAKKGEKITTLDEKTYNLDENILVIADSKKPIAIAGIKGGKGPKIDKKTKTIILESANFEQHIIRRGAKKLNLKTDASLRFEHGLDPNLTEFAINRAAFLLQEIAKGKVAKGIIDIYPKKVLPKEISLDLNYLESLLGVKIPEKDIKNILKALGFQFQTKTPSTSILQSIEVKKGKRKESEERILKVKIPTFRRDIGIAEDLIEEIGRIWGFEKIVAAFPLVVFVPPKRNEKVFWRSFARNSLKELGFTEVYNYSFISEEQAEIFSIRDNLIALENPISSEQKYLRPSLIPNLLKNVKDNSKFPEIGEIKIFELGKIFSPEKEEKEMLAGLIFQRKSDEKGFYRLKGVIDTLLNQMGISDIWYDDYQATPEESPISIWQAKKTAEIKVAQEEIGFLGEISPRILKNYEILGEVFLFDLDFEKLQSLATKEQEYRPLSPYPSAVRDIAILVPQRTKVIEVLNIINRAGGELVRDVDLFDIYEGEELPEGKKNLAFHIIYQAKNRTLSSEEIAKIHQTIIKALEKNPLWEVRG